MKTSLTILFLLFTICSSFGQLSNSFDIIIGVDRTFRNVNVDENSEFFEPDALDDLISIREGEEAKFNWRIGANYNRSLSENNYLKFGVRLSSLGYKKSGSSDLRFGDQHDGMGGFDPTIGGVEFEEVRFEFNYLFIELPVSFGLTKTMNKFSFYGEAGLSPNIYLTSRIKQTTDIDSSTSLQGIPGFRRLHLSGILAAGLAYQINDNFSVFGQPSFRYHLTNTYKEGFVKEHLYSYGIEFGVRKNIGVDKN